MTRRSVMYSVPKITDLTTEQFDRTMKTNICERPSCLHPLMSDHSDHHVLSKTGLSS